METGAGLSTRSGPYIAQSTGYRAFVPAPLPPQARGRTDRRIAGSAFGRRPRSGAARRVGADIAEPGPLCLHVCAQGGCTLQPDRGDAEFAAGSAGGRGAAVRQGIHFFENSGQLIVSPGVDRSRSSIWASTASGA